MILKTDWRRMPMRKNSKKAKFREALFFLIIALVLALITAGVVRLMQTRRQYNAAAGLSEVEQYEDAVHDYDALGDYRDSERRKQEAETLRAQKEYEAGQRNLVSGNLLRAAMRFGSAGDYLDARSQSFELWDRLARRNTLAAGERHTVALLESGSVVAAGDNSNGACNVSFWSDVVAVAAGADFTLGLKSDGSVLLAGEVNDSFARTVESWQDIISVNARSDTAVALKSDGTVLVAGGSVPQSELNDWAYISDVFLCRSGAVVGLKIDGTLAVAGSRSDSGLAEIQTWSGVRYAEGDFGLHSDGRMLSVSEDYDVSDWENILEFALDDDFIVGVRTDGTVAVAYRSGGAARLPLTEWTEIVEIAAGDGYAVGLKNDGTAIATAPEEAHDYGQCDVSGWRKIRIPLSVAS